MTMQLLSGRPSSAEGRLNKEIRVYDYLDALGVEYERVDHEPAMTMEDCEQIDKVLKATTCKNLLLCNRQQTDFYLLLMPADKQFKTKDISAQLGTARLSFASAEHMEALLDITPGSLSIMGLMNDTEHRVELLIDGDVLSGEYIGFHPCINTTSMRVRTEDLTKKIIPSFDRKPTMVVI